MSTITSTQSVKFEESKTCIFKAMIQGYNEYHNVWETEIGDDISYM